jgi:hypothetical protein
MKGFVEIPTRPMNSSPTSGYSTTLVAVDVIATVAAQGPGETHVVLKTLGAYPVGVINDTLTVGMTYRSLIEELKKAAA